ncbi:hypothetical protein L9F63_016433, partial [Diploptera punctata]
LSYTCMIIRIKPLIIPSECCWTLKMVKKKPNRLCISTVEIFHLVNVLTIDWQLE